MKQTINKTNIQKDYRKKKPFNLSHDVNTTFGLGYIEPMTTIAIPVGGSTISLDVTSNSVIRFEPLARPTFGRCSFKTWSCFVPLKDIYKYSNNVLLQTPVVTSQGTTVTPSNFPTIDSAFLMFILLSTGGNRCEIFKRVGLNVTTSNFNNVTTGLSTLFDSLVPNIFLSTSNNFKSVVSEVLRGESSTELGQALTFRDKNSTDYWHMDAGDFTCFANNGTDDYCISFKLCPVARRLLKIFNVVGYKPTFRKQLHYSLLPILAYGKGLFDLFNLPQNDDWEQTEIHKLMQSIYNTASYDFNSGTCTHAELSSAMFSSLVDSVRYGCIQWYPEDKNMVSSAVDLSAYGSGVRLRYNNVTYTDPMTSADADIATAFGWSNGAHSRSSAVNMPSLEVLKKLWYTCNRQSVIGNDTRKLLSALGYNENIDEQDSTFIGSTSQLLEVSEVTATTDDPTVSQPLGDSAGRSVTYCDNQSKFTYSAKEIGFVFVYATIVPESGFVNQVPSFALATNKSNWYNPEFDGVGYESMPRGSVGSLMKCECVNNQTARQSTVFGSLPRYTGFKCHGNILNGNFSLGSKMENDSAYHFDRIILENDFTAKSLGNGEYSSDLETTMSSDKYFPNAGVEWRYPTRYKWLGNFERVFTDSSLYGSPHYGEKYFYTYDRIIGHFNVNCTLFAPMLPVEDSWNTLDYDDVDKTTTSVRN